MRAARSTFIQEYFPGSIESPWSSDSEDFSYPDPMFIVSQSVDGRHITYFHQDTWKLHFLSETLKTNDTLHFASSGGRGSSREELSVVQSKCVILVLLKHALKSAGVPLGIASLNRYNILLARIREYCYKSKLTVHQALSDPNHIEEIFNKWIIESKSKTIDLEALLVKLSYVPFRYLGFKPALRGVVSKSSRGQKAKSYAQTAVIPPSIYFQLLNNYKAVLDKFSSNFDAIRNFVLRASRDKRFARNKKRAGIFMECASDMGLAEYFKSYNVGSLKSLSKHIGMVQYCCIMLIYVFSGMRNSEAYSLGGKSLKRVIDGESGVVKRRFLLGVTTKLKARPTPAKWVTSVDVETPFSVACKIAELIYNVHGVDFNSQPIFIAISYLPFSPGLAAPDSLGSKRPIWGNFEPEYYEPMLNTPLISEADICVLESITPTRMWRGEKEYSIGKKWPLSIHQIRRSTAVYAIRSGLVSLPALKMMLQHITIEMSIYYARGSSFAPDLLKEAGNDKDAFVNIYQSAELQVRAWQYTNEFIFSDEVLRGPHGVWLRGKAKALCEPIKYAEALEQTLARMKKGELFYQPTVVGGCISTEVCHKRISVNFLGCDGCKSAAIKPSKVLKLIEVQEALVSTCEPNSPEFNAENQTLFELKEFSKTMRVAG